MGTMRDDTGIAMSHDIKMVVYVVICCSGSKHASRQSREVIALGGKLAESITRVCSHVFVSPDRLALAHTIRHETPIQAHECRLLHIMQFSSSTPKPDAEPRLDATDIAHTKVGAVDLVFAELLTTCCGTCVEQSDRPHYQSARTGYKQYGDRRTHA